MKSRVRRAVLSSAGVAFATLSVGAAGCRRPPGTSPGVPGPMASALLAFAAEQGTPPETVADAWSVVETIAARVSARSQAPGQAREQDPLDRLNAVVFADLGFAREIESVDPQFLLLPSVVAGKRGGCVGLGALYLTLGERLGIPLAGMLVPGHFFVRATGARARNVELLRGGQAMPDDWYVGKYGPWDAEASSYMRPLSIAEVIAVHWFNVGNQRRADGNLPGAMQAYSRAVTEFPAFAEAAAALGAVEHLSGDLSASRSSYRAAARARPDLPGLAHNLSLLDAEQSALPAAGSRHPNQHKIGNSPPRSSP